jgi:hypothetical protein
MATALGMLGDETIAPEVARRLCPETPPTLRGQMLIAAANSIGAGNELYQYLHMGESRFEESLREITGKVRSAIEALPSSRDLANLWVFLDVHEWVQQRDYRRVVRSAYEFALLLYGKDLYPGESAAGGALAVLAAREDELLWDSALLALVSLEITIRKYPQWFSAGPES